MRWTNVRNRFGGDGVLTQRAGPATLRPSLMIALRCVTCRPLEVGAAGRVLEVQVTIGGRGTSIATCSRLVMDV